MAALIGLGTILTALTFVWMLSLRLQDASVADIFWGLGFVLLAWLYCLRSPALTQRSWLVAALITLWGTRLSAHIFHRHQGNGEDPRYQAMRASHGGHSGGGACSRSSGCRAQSCGSSPCRSSSRCVPRSPPQWLTVLSPSLMTLLLMRVSGVTLLEDGLKASKPGYRAYIARTPSFFPWFPRVPT